MAAVDTSRSGGSADSYIGSLISLTSKSEIRYEGVLFNINTEESSIGLRNVRSFGTEGRKKDGPQIPPSDKIYEYILFRGSDIKDLQVKSSPPPVQPAPPIHNDPAIIQSHYPHLTSTSTSVPSIGSGTIPDLGVHPGQVGLPRTTFQGGLPLYQPGGSLGSWGSSPAVPTANGSGLGMPMYWQGFYAPPGGLPHLQQQPLLRPPPGLQMPQSMQQPLQFPGITPSLPSLTSNLTGTNASLPSASLTLPGANTSVAAVPSNLPEIPSLLPPISGIASLSSVDVPSTVALSQANLLAAEVPQTLLANKSPVTSLPVTTGAASLSFVPPLVSKPESFSEPIPSMPRAIPGPNLPYQSNTQPAPTNIRLPSPGQGEVLTPILVTPGQLLQSGPSTIASTQTVQTAHKEAGVKPAAPELPKEEPTELKAAVNESKEPILPTPPDRKANGALHTHAHHNYRGRGRGRGHGYSRPVTKFTEDFDFSAMNEKFKKDEVWGHLGISKGHVWEREGDANEYDDSDIQVEDDAESSKPEIKPVYVKDDFFDSLSCNALDRGSGNGRTKFSEQLKIDSETFGDFPRYRPGRGGGRGFRGGGRARGSYYGRGFGYGSRGRGYSAQNWAS